MRNKEMKASLRVNKYRFKKYNIEWREIPHEDSDMQWSGRLNGLLVACEFNSGLGSIVEYQNVKKNIEWVLEWKLNG